MWSSNLNLRNIRKAALEAVIGGFMRKQKTGAEKAFTFVIGGLLGASVALLLAPQTGSRTRKQLAKVGKQASNRTQQFVGEIAESMDDVIGEILKAGSQGIKKGKTATHRASHEILEVLDAGKKYLEEERGKLEKLLK